MRKKNEDRKHIRSLILSELTKNSRIRNNELAKKVGISEKSVKVYIEELVKEGVIKSFTITLGSSDCVEAFININVMKGANLSQICKSLLSKGYCNMIVELSGEYDILCRIRASSIEQINERIDEIRYLKGIEKTRSFVVLKKWY